jgi:nucleoside-diphosphate-sugar epimerase
MDTDHVLQPILVTGGTGFAGRHLITALIHQGYRNIHTTHFGHSPLPEVCQSECVTVHTVNLTEANAVADLVRAVKPAHIYHLASFAAVGKSFDQAEAILQNNIMLQLHVLNAVKDHAPTARVLIIGSAEEYGKLPPELLGKKIDESFPLNAILYCLKEANVRINEIDAITFYEKPLIKFERILETFMKVAPYGLKTFVVGIAPWLSGKMFAKNFFIKDLKKIGNI